jgi:hypothetical protein
MTASPYSLTTRVDTDRNIAVCEAHVLASTKAVDRDILLTEAVFAVTRFLVECSALKDGRAVVDLRLPDAPLGESLPGAYAFMEAVRGLVQSMTLETGPHAAASNVLVSTESQCQAREATLAYLTSEGGGFSRGATYDLRNI